MTEPSRYCQIDGCPWVPFWTNERLGAIERALNPDGSLTADLSNATQEQMAHLGAHSLLEWSAQVNLLRAQLLGHSVEEERGRLREIKEALARELPSRLPIWARPLIPIEVMRR